MARLVLGGIRRGCCSLAADIERGASGCDSHNRKMGFARPIFPLNLSVSRTRRERYERIVRIYSRFQQGSEYGSPPRPKAEANDALVIKNTDRLGRNYEAILEQWRLLTKKKCVEIVVLDMPLLDMRLGRDLTGTLITDIVLQLLNYVAQTEREFIHQRQAGGIAAAKARGVRFGRRPKEPPTAFEEVYREWKPGLLTARKAAKRLGVTHKTFLKWASKNLPGEESRDSSPLDIYIKKPPNDAK